MESVVGSQNWENAVLPDKNHDTFQGECYQPLYND
jgi:hypothetical protein